MTDATATAEQAVPDQDAPTAEEWEIVELFGHLKYAGRVAQVERYGTPMMRLDIPAPDGDGWAATMFIGGGALFRETPCSEDLARQLARSYRPPTVYRLELAAPTPAYEPDTYEPDDDADDGDGYDPEETEALVARLDGEPPP